NHQFATHTRFGDMGKKRPVVREAGPQVIGKMVDQPEPRVMPRGFVTGTGITQPDDQAQRWGGAHHISCWHSKKPPPLSQYRGLFRNVPQTALSVRTNGRRLFFGASFGLTFL